MTTRFQELFAGIAEDDDDTDEVYAAIQQLADEATADWLPELRAAFDAAPDFVVREVLAIPLARFGGVAELPLLLEGLRKGTEERHDNDGLQSAICDLVEADRAGSFVLLEK